jgi:peptidylprolyl isomerase
MLENNPLTGYVSTSDRVQEVKIEDIIEGTGAEVRAGQTITAHYTGARCETGIVFQSSKDGGNSFTSSLNNLIEGWKIGIPGMKVGGTRRLVIPAALAYGDDPNSGRPHGDLVFDIELLDIK